MNIDMTMLRWKENKLYYGEKNGKFTGTYLEKHASYPNMYYVVTDKGTSDDFYNIDWAKQHGIRLAKKDMGIEE